jgi:uncharacterized membrane protein YfcA
MTGNDDGDTANGHARTWLSGMGDAVAGGLLTILGAFPVAAVVALVFRFPIPFAGYQSGVEAMVSSPIAVLLYGVATGGFVVLGVIGAVAGVLIGASDRSKQSILIAALTIDTVAIGLLSVWDKIYGPW